jgi:hypothetical protein
MVPEIIAVSKPNSRPPRAATPLARAMNDMFGLLASVVSKGVAPVVDVFKIVGFKGL